MEIRVIRKILLVVLLFCGAAMAQRLPQTVVPSHYQLTLEPDFAAGTFRGEAVIDVDLLEATQNVTLNAVDLNIEEASIRAVGRTQQASVEYDRSNQTLLLSVPQALAKGAAQLSLRYTGKFSSGLRGFYTGLANGGTYAATDFEPADARRMFPAFDEPAFKATFDVTAVVPRGDVAISNSPIVSDRNGPGGNQHTVRFATTPKMSTYLVALIVGDFVCSEGKADDTPIRVCATPDKKRLTGFALEAAEASLDYFNRYFAIRFPFPKLDLIALPDFAAGAMENTGAITFREALLLVDPKESSLDTRKQIAVVVAHEVSHQWFGDLVTMQWWDDIWLNEGFATWMESKAVANWKPEWQMELDEVQELGSSLDQDAHLATRPIRVSSSQAETPAQIEGLFDGIAYDKAAAVLRMLENYVGEDAFRKGVNEYLKRHAYGNTRASDFWSAVTDATGKPVDKIMPTFVNQPGVPMVSVQAACEGNHTQVTLAQQRFFVDRKELENHRGSELWQIPVCMQAEGGKPAACWLLTQPIQSFHMDGCPAVLFANADAEGYYVTEYAAAESKAIKARLTDLSASEDVILLMNDWSLVMAGQQDIASYLELAQAFQSDPTPAVWDEITGSVRFLSDRLLQDSPDTEAFRAWVRGLLRPLADKLGWKTPSDESGEARELRSTILFTLGRTGQDPQVLQQANQLALEFLENRSHVEPSLAGTVLNLAASQGDAALYERYLARLRKSTRPDEFYGWLSALTAFRDPTLLRRTLDLTLTPEVRGQDVMRVLSGVLGNPAGREIGWDFLRNSWPDLERKMPASNLARFAGLGALFCDAGHRRQFQEFFTPDRIPGFQREVQRSLEAIDTCIYMRQAQSEDLKAWLNRQPTLSQ
jgi:puromycin-sensitive aminopeptidase